MKLEYTTGCICDSLTIDGVETINMKVEDLQRVICKIINKEEDIAILQQVLINLIEVNGEYKYLGHCECCGDHISNYTLEVE